MSKLLQIFKNHRENSDDQFHILYADVSNLAQELRVVMEMPEDVEK